ncbi:Acetyltransferase (GNAT) family protein [Amycolatopsis marina]|uniref:Acetyltransferase (GNAT) family protein n=1 Tax=Amycolatopsis marina TaxID=490629 RepID=A0A1I0XFS1_9PSEU|nr:GNAT family N-acetyltransferase [Amycolatopsis marina]SFA99764.1 Acetyltransferase (GNAT) family protein [Amycolatopsis marina]
MTDLVVRPLNAGEQHLFHALPEAAQVGFPFPGKSFDALLAKGEYRPEWTWIALRGERIVARAAWWAGPDDAEPITLHCLDFGDDIEAAVALLRGASIRAEYCLALPPGWQRDTERAAATRARIAVAEQAGMRRLVDRLRYTWTPDRPLEPRPGRLEFRPEPDDDVIFDVLRRIHAGTLDAHAQADIRRGGLDAAAASDLEFLRWMPSPREWWLLAHTPGGELVGLTVPGRNYTGPVVGIIGVVPEQRGHGYGYDLLVECTHRLVEAGEAPILAETDATNTPMAAAFARAGYPVTQERTYLHFPA